MPADDETAAFWKSADAALVAGDVPTLERLLREQGEMFRRRRPSSSRLLPVDYSGTDARTIILRNHQFESWDQFTAYADALKDDTSPVARFEQAVDAIVAGDATTLRGLLKRGPDLIGARSTRPHHSTLLHYIGANGVEGFRQRTPQNAVEIAEILLDAGAEIDAAADMYGGRATTLGLVATSIHPKVAGVLRALIDLLLARGARLEARGAGNGHQLVNGCLANGRGEAAEYLAKKGAPLDLEGAAGVGRLDLVRSFFNADGRLKETATIAQMNDGFTWACEYGRTDVIEYLLDRGINVGEPFTHPHGQTGLHWATLGGHVDTVKALLKRGAPLDVRDKSFNGTPLGWALHGWFNRQEGGSEEPYFQVVALLVRAGAPVESGWLSDKNIRANPRMFAALTGKISDS